MSGSIEVRTRGLTQMKTFASAAKDIPKWAFPLVVEEMRLIGIAAGKVSIKETTGTGMHGRTGSTGKLHDTFEGLTHVINKEHHRVEIGSNLDYAEHASTGTLRRLFNRRVQVLPYSVRDGYVPAGGGWFFIGQRAEVKGHPFMEAVSDKIETELNPTISRILNQGWANAGNKGRGAPPVP